MSLPSSDKPNDSDGPHDSGDNTGSLFNTNKPTNQSASNNNTGKPDNSNKPDNTKKTNSSANTSDTKPGSTPPPGSKGYRKQGDPLPRGIPLTGSSRRSSKSSASISAPPSTSPTSISASSAAPSASIPAATPKPTPKTTTPKPDTRPQTPTSGKELPRSNQPPVVRPPAPAPIRSSIGDTASVLGSPKVPATSRPATPPASRKPSTSPAAAAASHAPVLPKQTPAPVPTPTPTPTAPIAVSAAAVGSSSAAGNASASSISPPSSLSPDAPLPSESAFPSPVDRRGMFLFIAILISLAAHGTLAWELYDRPLSYIDPALIHEQRDVYRVFRAPQDLILPDEATNDSTSTDGKKPADEKHESPLADLSMAMLSAPAEEQPKPALSATLEPAARPFADQKPQTPDPEGAQGVPDIQLPDNIQDQLKIDIPLATLFVGSGGSGKQGKGPGSAAGSPNGSGQNQAASLLAQGDGFGDGIGDVAGAGYGVPANPLPPAMAPPSLTDKAAINDSRAMPRDLMPARVDLSSITDNAATRLSIPEHLDNDFDYAVTTFIPKGGWGIPADEERGYFQVDITAKRSLKKLQTMPKDLVILVDTSGSVPQIWLDRTLEGISDSLSSLNPQDRFNIVFFAEETAVLSPDGNMPVNEANLDKARKFLASGKSGGNTDVNQALSRLLVRDVAVDRAYELILISDGRPTSGVMNTRELINLITRDNDLAASIYCVGIGPRQNKTLLEFLAYRNKGFCVYAENPILAAISIRDLISRLRYPIMKDIRLTLLGLNIEEVFPSDLPTIHQGETFSIFGRFDNPGKPFTMRLLGHNGKQMFDFTFTRDLTTSPNGKEQISRDWGFWKLHHIYNQILRQGESSELRMAISYLRRKYKLNTLYD